MLAHAPPLPESGPTVAAPTLHSVPDDVLMAHVFLYLQMDMRCQFAATCKWNYVLWIQSMYVATLHIRVPQDVPTIENANVLAKLFAKHRKRATVVGTIVVALGAGIHEVKGKLLPSVMTVSCANLHFRGQGKDITIVKGGIKCREKNNISLSNLTITNPRGVGLALTGTRTKVAMSDVSVNRCSDHGLCMYYESSCSATRCDFKGNTKHGIYLQFSHNKLALIDCVSQGEYHPNLF